MKPFTVIGLLLAAGLLALAVANARRGPATESAARAPMPPPDAQRARTFHPPPRDAELAADGTTATTRRSVALRRTRRTAGATVIPATRPASQLPTGQPLADAADMDEDDEDADDEMEPIIPLEIAREALGLVGHDPEAEDAWIEAINDPALTDDERKDLIEDLNAEGFEDPEHLTPDDLPLILSRIELIEELAPDAMDDVNADAFEEAYENLTEMLAKLEAEMEAEEARLAAAEAAAAPGATDVYTTPGRSTRRVSARR